ncbi:facilitated trehalose transporter Tret1-like [Neodiprion virginianus]|uniref:facilitated trehalose transporter Tret1-like n=1 Tax=Neodiprion virginianus TaxID=2961670 RepID=UPI001EE7336A|nr:facilitated trehalose transporter Tret1-like [Neodiprion virginianus]
MTAKRDSVSSEGILWLQYIGSLGAALLLFMTGMSGGWTSPFIAKLTAENSSLPITLDEASWVASMLNLGRVVGAVPGPISVYYFGSKRTMVFNGIPCVVGWVSMIIARSVDWLYVGRFVIGLSVGMCYSSFPLYLGEISSPAIRGALVTLASIGLPVGVLTGNTIGAYVSMSVFAWISLVPNIIYIVLFIWLPESPYHLVRTNKIEEAKVSIAKYNPRLDVNVEVRSIQDFINESQSVTLADKFRELNIPENRKAGIIVTLLYFFMQFSGMSSFIFYLEIILTNGGLTVIPPATMVIVASLAGILAGFATIYLADKCGRRTLLIVSSAGTAASMIALGVHYVLLDANFDPASLQWLLILSVIFYEVFLYIGLCPVPNTVLSELFAPNIKSMVACLSGVSLSLFSFVSSKTYQSLLEITSEACVFFLYGAVAITSLVFGLTVMPETKGKSLQEIQDELHKK